MTDPVKLAAIVGSLRADSFSRRVFGVAAELVAPDVQLTEVGIRDVPFYDGDVEAGGDPAAVVRLKASVAAAAGLIVFTPEYNRSVPAVTKNAIDWLSRPAGDSVLSRTVVGVVAATPGRHGASGVRAHLADALGSSLYEPSLGIASVGHQFTNGELTDEDTRDQLKTWLAGFIAVLSARMA